MTRTASWPKTSSRAWTPQSCGGAARSCFWSRPSTAELSTLTRDAVRERFPNGHVLQFSAIDEMTFHQQSDSA